LSDGDEWCECVAVPFAADAGGACFVCSLLELIHHLSPHRTREWRTGEGDEYCKVRRKKKTCRVKKKKPSLRQSTNMDAQPQYTLQSLHGLSAVGGAALVAIVKIACGPQLADEDSLRCHSLGGLCFAASHRCALSWTLRPASRRPRRRYRQSCCGSCAGRRRGSKRRRSRCSGGRAGIWRRNEREVVHTETAHAAIQTVHKLVHIRSTPRTTSRPH